MLWQYPGDPFPTQELVKVTSSKDNWLKLSQRLKLPWQHMRKYWLDDLSGMKVTIAKALILENMDPIKGGFGLIQPYNNMSISIIPGTASGYYKITGEGYENFKQALGKNQERGLETWCQSVINIQERVKEIEETQTLDIQKSEKIEPIPFAIIGGLHVNTPKATAPYRQDNIFMVNDAIMREAYPLIEPWIQMNSAPKSWMYDYLVGRTKVASPQLRETSAEMSALIWDEYEPSLVLAMMTKRTRSENKWQRLQKYAQEQFQLVYEQEAGPHTSYKMY